MKRLVVTLVVAAFTSVASGQQAILLVRHAEKATESNESGVPLSQAGRARAARLAETLKNAGVTAVYTTDTDRAKQTAEPLARAAKVEVRIYSPRDASGKLAPELLLERLKKEEPSGIVLVVGHQNTVPDLLTALGHREKIEIAASQYDDLFVIVPRAGGPPSVVRLKY
ncbi:MAG TPA: histidine phosphatase family protein [Thermoanaerobaculia bacterium]